MCILNIGMKHGVLWRNVNVTNVKEMLARERSSLFMTSGKQMTIVSYEERILHGSVYLPLSSGSKAAVLQWEMVTSFLILKDSRKNNRSV
jgi:hypothetical protein